MLEAQIHGLTGGTKRTRELYRKGVKRMIEKMNSEEFKVAVHQYRYKDTNGTEHLNFKLNILPSGQSVSRGELYHLLMSGWDKFDNSRDKDIDINASLYYKRWSSVVGYTYGGTIKTWINTKFWTGSEKQKVAKIAGNVAHEYMHNMGFSHSFNSNPTRKYTVPYAIGTIIFNLLNEEEDDLQADREYICKRTWYTLWLTKKCSWIKK